MNKLFPIANETTRQYFVDPAHFFPTDIQAEGYNEGEQTAFLKPGKVGDLMDLCRPKGVFFAKTEEPDPENIVIDEMIVGLRGQIEDDVVGSKFHLVMFENVNIKLEACGPSSYGLNGVISIMITGKETTATGLPISWMFNKGTIISIPFKASYSRGSRCFEFAGEGTYDNGKPVVFGIKLDLTHKDSRSSVSPFKYKPTTEVKRYHREIVA